MIAVKTISELELSKIQAPVVAVIADTDISPEAMQAIKVHRQRYAEFLARCHTPMHTNSVYGSDRFGRCNAEDRGEQAAWALRAGWAGTAKALSLAIL